MKTLSEMSVLELLDEEAKASLKLSQSPAGSNAQRVADRRLDNVLAEMQSRTAEPVLSASAILACVMTMCLLVLSACGADMQTQEDCPPLVDNFANCYVAPADIPACVPLVPFQAQAWTCNAPQTRPVPEQCLSLATDTGTNIGSKWCCSTTKINGTQP